MESQVFIEEMNAWILTPKNQHACKATTVLVLKLSYFKETEQKQINTGLPEQSCLKYLFNSRSLVMVETEKHPCKVP